MIEEILKLRAEVKAEMMQMNGTENWYQTILPGLTYTDGIKMIAEKCKAYWLIDVIVSYQTMAKVRKLDLQVWTLTVTGNYGRIVLEDDDNKVIVSQEFEYTDFPLDKIIIWVSNKVILLPSEY